ncbi:MAG: HEAT repeat domain-containing protein [Schlesneria sp.]
MRSATSANLPQPIQRLMAVFLQPKLTSFGRFPGPVRVIIRMIVGGLMLFAMSANSPLNAEQTRPQKNDDAEALKKDGGRQIDSKRFVAQLTPKLSVELIAVTTPQFTEETDDSKPGDAAHHQWWRPDGTPLEVAPAAPAGKKISLRATRGSELIREFLIRIEGLDHPHSLWGATGRGGGFVDEGKDSAKESVVLRLTDIGATATRTTDVVIALAHEEWGPIQKLSPDAKPINAIEPPESYGFLYEEFQLRRFKDGYQRTSFWFNPLADSWGPIIDYRIEGFDQDGEPVPCNTHSPRYPSTTNYYPFTATFQDQPKPVARVEYKLRPFRHKVTFKNVSLLSSRDTTVKIETVTLEENMRAWPGKSAPHMPDEFDQGFNDARGALNDMSMLQVTNMPIRDVLDYLEDLHHIKIELSEGAKELHKDLDTKGVTLNSKNQSLKDVVILLLHPFKLSYLVEDGKLVIATPLEVRHRGAELPLNFNQILVQLSSYPTVKWEGILRGEINDADAKTISKLEAAILDEDPVIQLQAANALYAVAKSAKSAIPHLKKLTTSNDWQLRRAAYWALAAIGSDDLSTLPMLIEAYPKDEVVQHDLTGLIREFPEREVAVELEKYYPTGSPSLRIALLQGVHGRAKSAEKLILLGLSDAEERIRQFSFHLAKELEKTDAVEQAIRNYSKSDGVPIK